MCQAKIVLSHRPFSIGGNGESETGESIPVVRVRLFEEAEAVMWSKGHDPGSTDPFTLARYSRRVTTGYFRHQPWTIAKAYVRGQAYLFVNLANGIYVNMLEHHPGLPDTGRSIAQITIMPAVGSYLFVTYVCTNIGLYLAWKHRQSSILLIFFAMAVYFVIVTGGGGMARFKLSVIPFYFAFSGIVFAAIEKWAGSALLKKKAGGGAQTHEAM